MRRGYIKQFRHLKCYFNCIVKNTFSYRGKKILYFLLRESNSIILIASYIYSVPLDNNNNLVGYLYVYLQVYISDRDKYNIWIILLPIDVNLSLIIGTDV